MSTELKVANSSFTEDSHSDANIFRDILEFSGIEGIALLNASRVIPTGLLKDYISVKLIAPSLKNLTSKDYQKLE